MEKPWIWPFEIAEYLQKWILEIRAPAFLIVDGEGRLVSKGGDLSHYGFGALREGQSASTEAYFLEGLLPLDGSSLALSRVGTAPGVFADIHLFHVQDGDCILLLDASEEVAERMQIEQALRRTEEQLRQAEKMEAIGRLAGGVAHDFNNLLTVILGYSTILADALTEGKLQTAAREVKEAASRAAVMTRHLLSFSRRQVRRVERLNVNAIISGLEEPLRRLIGEDIVLSIILDSSLASVEADRGQLEQILINLAVNARDAMPKGGPLEIRTANVRIDEPYISSHTGIQVRHGTYASISVSDRGCGMDAETRAHAFEPFFTSKAPGQGTGLGLSIVHGIVSQSGGEIILTSEVGKGTRIKILLPAAEEAATVAKAAAAGHGMAAYSPARGTETVLVVEDEDPVRRLIREVLTDLGYIVLESAEPPLALAMCERYAGRIDLLVTDFIMPQMNGRELAERIVAAHPETRVLYVSGYTKESFAKRGMELPGSVFLGKPFTPALLADRVREALCRPASL